MIKGLVISMTSILISTSAFAGVKSICGSNDDRVLSFDAKIGRLSVEGKHKGCTVTMISETCGYLLGMTYLLQMLKFLVKGLKTVKRILS